MSSGNAPQASANQRSVWNAAAEQLEVVGEDEERPGCDEGEQPERPREGGPDADRGSGGDGHDREADEHARRDLRRERPPVQLVERVRADPEREEEGERRRARARSESTCGARHAPIAT